MKILWIIIYALQVLLALYLLQPFFFLLIYYFRRIFLPYSSPVKRKPKIEKQFDFAAIVTAHKDTRFIKPLVDSLLKQTYNNLHVYVIADACDISELRFETANVSLIKPKEDLNAKTKSIALAYENFVRPHDALVIFDSDNLAHPEYFSVLNAYFQQGYNAVQTHMLPKNTDTLYAQLDAMGHVYHNFLERKMRMQSNLSTHILGLGIAVHTDLYKEILYKDSLGGFDKKLQAELVKRLPLVAFADEAYVYDEKVEDKATLEKQRSRWTFAYFHYFKASLNLFLTGIKKFSFNKIFFGLNTLVPPLSIVLIIAIAFTIINFFVNPILGWAWVITLFLYVMSFCTIVITHSNNRNINRALLKVPLFAISQLKAMLNIGQASKSFLKTEHNRVLYIEDVLA